MTPLLDVAAAVLLGAAFGAALERAGLGNATKLLGQFRGTDFTVFQVMFTALLTAGLGLFWLGVAGEIDLHLSGGTARLICRRRQPPEKLHRPHKNHRTAIP